MFPSHRNIKVTSFKKKKIERNMKFIGIFKIKAEFVMRSFILNLVNFFQIYYFNFFYWILYNFKLNIRKFFKIQCKSD